MRITIGLNTRSLSKDFWIIRNAYVYLKGGTSSPKALNRPEPKPSTRLLPTTEEFCTTRSTRSHTRRRKARLFTGGAYCTLSSPSSYVSPNGTGGSHSTGSCGRKDEYWRRCPHGVETKPILLLPECPVAWSSPKGYTTPKSESKTRCLAIEDHHEHSVQAEAKFHKAMKRSHNYNHKIPT